MSWLTSWLPDWPLIRRLRPRTWVRGRYTLGPEVSSFQPEGSAERWWTSFSDGIASEARTLMESARGNGIVVELAGVVSEPGAYGHMGQYDRTFEVEAIRRP